MCIGCRINACHRGSRVFEPGPCGGVFRCTRDRLRNSPEMAVFFGKTGGDQEAFGFGRRGG